LVPISKVNKKVHEYIDGGVSRTANGTYYAPKAESRLYHVDRGTHESTNFEIIMTIVLFKLLDQTFSDLTEVFY
jgi:hypothetical protein